MSDRTKTLAELAHDAGEADALWWHQIGDRMSTSGRDAFIREQARGGFVPVMSHYAGPVTRYRTGDLALAWQQGFESTLQWLEGQDNR